MKIIPKQSGIVAQVLIGEGDDMATVQVTVPYASLDEDQRKVIDGMVGEELEKNPPEQRRA